ncbi:MAG: hypothetical protein Kow00121_40960 [Elainellaceae cyanobacterium]
MVCRLTPFSWYSALPLNHPERFPTFMPLLGGGIAVWLGLLIVAGAPLLWLLVPIGLTGCILSPRSQLLTASLLTVLVGWLLLLPSVDIELIRQAVAIGGVIALSPLLRGQLLQREWQFATQSMLAKLLQNQQSSNPEQAIAQALVCLQSIAVADAAIALHQLDAVTAEVLGSVPADALPMRLTTPSLFTEAIAQNCCLYYANYPAVPNAAPILIAQDVKVLVVIPLCQPEQLQGAILLYWRHSHSFSPYLKQCIEGLRGGLCNLLKFQDITLRLEKLQARLVSMLETLPQGIIFVDESGEQGWLNHIAALYLNLPQGAVAPIAVAQAMMALRMRADNHQDLAAQGAQFFAQPQVEIRDWQWQFSNPYQVLSFSSAPIHQRGTPGRLWVIDDVTERRLAEEALRTSEERFQLIVHATNDTVWDWDLLTNQLWWNEGIETLFGYTPDQIGQGVDWWYERIHPQDREQVVTSIHAIIHQGQHSWASEYRYLRADGTYAYVFDRGYVIHSPENKPVRMLGGMTDITDRKLAQEELERQNRRAQLFAEVTLKIRQSLQLQEILQTSVTEVQKILIADRVLVYRLWADGTGSGVAEEVLPGLPKVLGRTFPDEVFPEQAREFYLQGGIRSITNVEDDRKIPPCLVKFVQQFKVKAKLVVPILTKAELWGLLIAHQCDSPRQWTDFEINLLQQLANQIGIALTQAQLLEQETRQRQELARSNAELQQFAYIASHDLQEPLRMVTSYLQLLERRYRGQLDADADDFIHYAVDGATRMKTLINDLLLYSRVGTHGKPFEQVDCTVALKRAIANLKIAIEESNATVTYEPLPQVVGDSGQLVQLFQNLVANAIKFQGAAAAVVQIRAEQQGQFWCFSVQDNGIGIEPEYAERIFVIFQRLHKRIEYPGTGIGLAVCKKIVERHGGQIWVQSEPGKGATFFFTLPIQGEPQYGP